MSASNIFMQKWQMFSESSRASRQRQYLALFVDVPLMTFLVSYVNPRCITIINKQNRRYEFASSEKATLMPQNLHIKASFVARPIICPKKINVCFCFPPQVHQLMNLNLNNYKMPRKTKKRVPNTLNTDLYVSSAEETDELNQKPYRTYVLRKAEALHLLNGTSIPSKFRFREQEKERIQAFVTSCVKEDHKGFKFLMITGAPGAGKSLCANSVLSQMGCKVIKMNANIVKSLAEVQQIVAEALLGQKIGSISSTVPHLLSLLEKEQMKQTSVVYIEEIELLFRAAPTPTTEDFMKLFQKKGFPIILIGISNTIDALQKYSGKFSFKIHEIDNVIFPPYTAEQIAEIMKDKIEQVRSTADLDICVPEKLLKFASQKLEALKKGDFRICLEFLKGVLQKTFEESPQEGEGGRFTVTIGYVNSVLNKMNISKDSIIEHLPYQQKVMLVALHSYIKKTDALAVSQLELQPEVRWICDSLQITYTKQLMSDGLAELEQYSLIEIKRKSDTQKIVLKISLQDIEAVFSEHFVFKKFFAK